jgi:hypothetical protein
VASGIFIKACNEFIFLESVASAKPAASQAAQKGNNQAAEDITEDLCQQVETILRDQDDDRMYASELKDTLLRLMPDFNERNYGCSTFGKLIQLITERNTQIKSWSEGYSLMISLVSSDAPAPQMNKLNWLETFRDSLKRFKDDGFERINPSILKAAIKSDFPDFDEKQIGFKRFSDIMKKLEKEGLLVVEMDEAHTMLLKIC